MKLDGLGIFVHDMPTMIRFYRDVLGFEIQEPEDTINVYLIKDGTLFMFYPRKEFEKLANRSFNVATGVNGHYEIALSVDTYDDVDKEYERLISLGVTPIYAPTTQPWGQRTCYIADPEGNLIEIGSFHKNE